MAAETRQHPDDQVFEIEQRGIQLVPATSRHGKPSDLFFMWLGTNLNVFYIVNGAIVIALGLSFSQALLVIAAGNLCFFCVGLTSLQGPKTGTSTFVISRAAYGPNGGRGLSVFNWLTCVGYEASGLALIVLAALELLAKAGVHAGTGVKAAVILGAAAVQFVLPLYGHATILAAEKWLAWLFIPLFAVMAILVAPKVHLGSLPGGAGWGTVMVAVAVIISGGGLPWANTGSDYSRYLPADSSARGIFWWSSLGGLIPSVLLSVLGAAVASVVKTASDPIAGVPLALPGWVAVPYLILAILTLLAVNTIDLYSSGLTLQAIGVPVRRPAAALIDLVICVAVTFVAIFSASFNRLYLEFLSLLIVWLAPWFAIYITDWLLRRGRYDPASLVREHGGRYWRRGGIHWPGIIAQAVGMIAALMWINSPAFTGPLSSRAGGSDLSVFTGMAAAGLTYWLLARRTVPAEEGLPVPVPAVPVPAVPEAE
jgi:nucleobase:cation symporter-1, NCS1 family